jgi:hypothetical protein
MCLITAALEPVIARFKIGEIFTVVRVMAVADPGATTYDRVLAEWDRFFGVPDPPHPTPIGCVFQRLLPPQPREDCSSSSSASSHLMVGITCFRSISDAEKSDLVASVWASTALIPLGVTPIERFMSWR